MVLWYCPDYPRRSAVVVVVWITGKEGGGGLQLNAKLNHINTINKRRGFKLVGTAVHYIKSTG